MMRLATAFVLAFTIASPLCASLSAVDTQACATYRKGPLVSQRLAIYSNPNAYEWLEIRYRYEYVAQPDLPNTAVGLAPETPDWDRLFEIEIATGQPRPPGQLRYEQSPVDYTHFSLLVDGRVYLQGLKRLIGIYAGLPLSDIWGEWVNGVPVDKDVPFERTGVFFHGYQLITVPGATEKDTEIFLQESEDGEITGFLRCDREGAYPNPGCTLEESSRHFGMSIRFNRSRMHLIKEIRNHARAFTACLTQTEEK